MKNLRKLGLSLTLIALLSTAAFAGETPSPPCVPGETLAPPCVAQPVSDDSANPGETSASPAAPTVNVIDITETVVWALSLF
jgi:hypothetical protein